MLFDVLEEEADLYPNYDGWLQVEGVARDMLEVAAPGSDAAKAGEDEFVYARARRESLLSAGERTDLERRCEAFLAANPKAWRAWLALIELRLEDVVRLQSTGQEQAASRRQEQLDKAIADMKAALAGMPEDAGVKLALAEVAFLLAAHEFNIEHLLLIKLQCQALRFRHARENLAPPLRVGMHLQLHRGSPSELAHKLLPQMKVA